MAAGFSVAGLTRLDDALNADSPSGVSKSAPPESDATVMTGGPQPTIMLWNIANLGGGFCYPQQRADGAIREIASLIRRDEFGVDICVVLEVLAHSRLGVPNQGKPPVLHDQYAYRDRDAESIANGAYARLEAGQFEGWDTEVEWLTTPRDEDEGVTADDRVADLENDVWGDAERVWLEAWNAEVEARLADPVAGAEFDTKTRPHIGEGSEAWAHVQAHLLKIRDWREDERERVAATKEKLVNWADRNRKHPGFNELTRIHGALCDCPAHPPAGEDASSACPPDCTGRSDRTRWSRWPDLDAVSGTASKNLVYTKSETYGVFCRHPWGVVHVHKPEGDEFRFEKRRPFVFTVRNAESGEKARIVAYHAPSDNRDNAGARERDFVALGGLLEAITSVDTVRSYLASDLNVDTCATAVRNIGDGAGRAPLDFLTSLTGYPVPASQAEAKTSLLRKDISAGDGPGGWDYESCAFDKVLPLYDDPDRDDADRFELVAVIDELKHLYEVGVVDSQEPGSETGAVADTEPPPSSAPSTPVPGTPGTPLATQTGRLLGTAGRPGFGSPMPPARAARWPMTKDDARLVLRAANRLSDHVPIVWKPAGEGGGPGPESKLKGAASESSGTSDGGSDGQGT